MHWTYQYKSESNLQQGDILQPTKYLIEEVLDRYHPYYSQNPDNKLYIVLTQSCDLDLRGGKSCKADYISLAPVRPLSTIIKREFSQHLFNTVDPDAQPYGSDKIKSLFDQFLRKIFNNNDPRYFYIRRQEDKHISQDMCAIISLSISIKSVHYSECTEARILQLDNVFQAKLGWLAGQRYSRVATQDWDAKNLQNEVNNVLTREAIWIPNDQLKKVHNAVKLIEQQNKVVDTEQLAQILTELPSKKQQAIDAIMEILASQAVLPVEEPKKKILRNKLQNDQTLSQFFSK